MHYWTARDLLADLVARRVSARELTDQAIARIEARDGVLNAVVVRDFDRARQSADAADAALAIGERRPLLGLPMTIKESFYQVGLPASWGFPPFKNWQPKEDAVAVARLKAAGAIIIGKTNVPLFLGDWQSFNEIYGTTNNPWDIERTPGGSSGGSAAALAAGFVSLEMGSDIGGSIRVPAHFCGVYGHKPSYPLVPTRGHSVPPGSDAPVDLAVCGPLARSATDLELALDVLAGPDEAQGIAYRLTLPQARHDRLRDFRVLLIDNHPLAPVEVAIRSAFDRLAERLKRAGVTVARESALLPDLEEATHTFCRLLMPIMAARRDRDFHTAMRRKVDALAADDLSLSATCDRAMVSSYADWFEADQRRGRLRREWQALFREWDVVICPPMGIVAPKHDRAFTMDTRQLPIDGRESAATNQMLWSGLATASGLPATVMPIDRGDSALPIGAQIIGPYLEDRTPLRFAGLVEREFGGFVPPPGY